MKQRSCLYNMQCIVYENQYPFDLTVEISNPCYSYIYIHIWVFYLATIVNNEIPQNIIYRRTVIALVSYKKSNLMFLNEVKCLLHHFE